MSDLVVLVLKIAGLFVLMLVFLFALAGVRSKDPKRNDTGMIDAGGGSGGDWSDSGDSGGGGGDGGGGGGGD